MYTRYLELLLDLLEIEDAETYLELASAIEKAPASQTFLFAHRGAFILQGYLDLLKGEMAPEEFVLLGDVESANQLWREGSKNAETLVHDLLVGNLPTEDILVMDKIAWQVLLTQDQKSQVETLLADHGKSLLLA